MPRALRVEYPGAHYHAMCRGNNGQEIFLDDDGRRLFLSTLDEVCQQAGWLIHAYVLMSKSRRGQTVTNNYSSRLVGSEKTSQPIKDLGLFGDRPRRSYL